MLVLLPPSETKQPGGHRPPLDLGADRPRPHARASSLPGLQAAMEYRSVIDLAKALVDGTISAP